VEKKKRNNARRGILAKFQFCIGMKSRETFEGITLDMSSEGFGFLTGAIVKEGQTITIKKHTVPDLKGKKAKVIWVKKGSQYIEAGAKISMDRENTITRE